MQEILLSVVETDLRLLAAEAKKAESMMGNLMGMLHHSELPALKDATERATRKVRDVGERQTGLVGVQQALVSVSKRTFGWRSFLVPGSCDQSRGTGTPAFAALN